MGVLTLSGREGMPIEVQFKDTYRIYRGLEFLVNDILATRIVTLSSYCGIFVCLLCYILPNM